MHRLRLVAAHLGFAACASSALAATSLEPPTYRASVAPLLQRHCVSCHRSGDVAPMSLTSYSEVRPWARAIARVVKAREMPPWFADPQVGRFRNERSLSESEIATVLDWVQAGAPQGEAEAASVLASAPLGEVQSALGPPDQIFSMPSDFAVPAEGVVEYHYLRLPTGLDGDRWVRAVEVRPGAREVVHHIDIMVCAANCPADSDLADLPAGVLTPIAGGEITRKPRARRRAAIDGGDSLQFLTSFLPGGRPSELPEGYAWLLPEGADLYFNIHYTPIGEQRLDKSSVALWFSEAPPRMRVTSLFLDNFSIWIPAGVADYQVETRATFGRASELLALTPHMHSRGKAAEVFLRQRGRRHRHEEPLLRVPRYDFNWQITYELEPPRPLRPGDVLRYLLRWDNSTDNPYNPDPNRDVPWGRQTSDEMASVFVTLAAPVDVEPRQLFE